MPPREIALGRDAYFKSLARQTGAAHWRQWAARGITRRTVQRRFGRAFHQAMKRADKIHFALDEIADPIDAVKKGAAGFKPGNFTNAELHYIASHLEFLNKTIFYRGGKVVPSPFG
ncbi:hypothetical protein HYR99_02785 [Candidatus Poribacteria bacterium]|nr:hypothetical protein [Candidatus Poribacteria bacterium]